MKFIYSADKTPQAPKETVIFGYTFIDGKATDVKDKFFVDKLSNMEHVGITKAAEHMGVVEAVQKVEQKEDDEFLEELTPNATNEHINNLVTSKSGNELEEYIIENNIKLKSTHKKEIKKSPNYKRAILAKYVYQHLERKIKNQENGIN